VSEEPSEHTKGAEVLMAILGSAMMPYGLCLGVNGTEEFREQVAQVGWKAKVMFSVCIYFLIALFCRLLATLAQSV
jgi:hypothetical protein